METDYIANIGSNQGDNTILSEKKVLNNKIYNTTRSQEKLEVVTSDSNAVITKIAWWKRWLNYSTWEWTVIIIAVIVAIVSFICSLIKAWPGFTKLSGNMISIAYAAGANSMQNSSKNYADIGDLIIKGGVLGLCIYSAVFSYHTKKDNRSKFARDLAKISLGYLFGRGTK